MRGPFSKSLIVLSLLVLGLSVHVSARPQVYVSRDDPKTLFRQVRSDLDRAQHDVFPRDTDSIEKARGEVNELEWEWDYKEYTPRQADYVITALERVLSENHLSFRDHSSLSDDLSRMRRFRDNHS